MKIKKFITAIWEGLRAFFRPFERVSGTCQNGHSLREGWPHCPECQTLKESALSRSGAVSGFLFGVSGAHDGELIALSERLSTIGTSSSFTNSLTEESQENPFFQVRWTEENGRIWGPQGGLKIREEPLQDSPLIDFDEVTLGENQFLAFTLNPQGVRHES